MTPMVGLLVAWGLVALPLTAWGIAAVMTALTVVIETLVVRNYGLAVVFITPLTIVLAEGARLGHDSPDALLQARLLDTVLGCVIGLLGAALMRSARPRTA